MDTETFANVLKKSVYQGAHGPTATVYAAKFLTVPWPDDKWVFVTRPDYYATEKAALLAARLSFELNLQRWEKDNPPPCYVHGAPPCDDPTCYHMKTLIGYCAEPRKILLDDPMRWADDLR
jgi:hypothetical protein